MTGKLIKGSFGSERGLEDLGVKVEITPASSGDSETVDMQFKIPLGLLKPPATRVKCSDCGHPATRSDNLSV